MIGLKRFIRPGVVISVIGHVGALMLGLFLVGANSLQPITPEAMVVEVVTSDEAPRLSGTPADARTSGTESTLKSHGTDTATQPPQPPQREQQQQLRPNPPRDTRPPSTQAPPPPQPQTEHGETAQPVTAEIQTSEPPQDHPADAPDQSNVAEMLAQMALAGGQFGGGFAAPPVDTNKAGYDFTAPFRERVSACSTLPPGIAPNEKIVVVMRVLLNRDGTLASPPRALLPILTDKQQALMESSIDALQKCQPYIMLPPDKYKLWKKLDLTFYPMSFIGR
jgi:hypothetical protein